MKKLIDLLVSVYNRTHKEQHVELIDIAPMDDIDWFRDMEVFPFDDDDIII